MVRSLAEQGAQLFGLVGGELGRRPRVALPPGPHLITVARPRPQPVAIESKRGGSDFLPTFWKFRVDPVGEAQASLRYRRAAGVPQGGAPTLPAAGLPGRGRALKASSFITLSFGF